MDWKLKVKNLWQSYYSKQYIYGYINCLWENKLIDLGECERLNNDINNYHTHDRA